MLRQYITGVAGFEPTHEGVKVPCLTAWLYPKNMEESGFEPLNQKERIYSPPRLATSLLLHYIKRFDLTGVAGFEPTHEGVKVPCLTAWLYPKNMEESGFEPLNQKERIYSPPRLATSLLLHDIKRSNLTGVAGFEPTHEGVKVPCLTAWLYPKKVEESGFEPLNQKERIYSPPRLATSLLLHRSFKSTIK